MVELSEYNKLQRLGHFMSKLTKGEFVKDNKFIQAENFSSDSQLKEGQRKTVGSNPFAHVLSTFYTEIGLGCAKFDVACSYLEVSAPGFKVGVIKSYTGAFESNFDVSDHF